MIAAERVETRHETLPFDAAHVDSHALPMAAPFRELKLILHQFRYRAIPIYPFPSCRAKQSREKSTRWQSEAHLLVVNGHFDIKLHETHLTSVH